MVALTVTPTRRPQESFWLVPARKLKPRRVTMLLLAVEKFGAVSWDEIRRLLRRWEVEMLRSVKKMLNGANGMSDCTDPTGLALEGWSERGVEFGSELTIDSHSPNRKL